MEIQTENRLSAKKLARLENKKKKMIAYLEIVRLNDQDRHSKKQTINHTISKMSSSDDEPSCKKVKIEEINTIQNKCVNDNMQTSNDKDLSKKHNTPSGKPKVDGQEYADLKKELKERKKRLSNLPRFKLNEAGTCSQISVADEDRIPIFLSDIQHLWLYTILGNHSPYKPQRWCAVQKFQRIEHVCVLVVEDISSRQYILYAHCFPEINNIFENIVEVVTPSVYQGELVDEIAAVPLTSSQKQKLVKEFGSLQEALNCSKVFSMLKAVFPVEQRLKYREEMNSNLPPNDKFPRTHLLLSPWQLVEENYPLPLKGSLQSKYLNYVMTKDVYAEVSPNSPMFAIDCEMCRTTTGQLELTRISVVNEKHESCYETLVKPHNKIVNYLTQFSGITAGMLKNVTKRLEDVQRELRQLLPADAILVGQSLNSDLHSLKMMHPYIIDTSIIFNLTGDRVRKTKLQVLARQFLDEKIQQGKDGHCSIEDSLSSLKLVQLKLGRSIEFGDAVLSNKNKTPEKCNNYGDNYYGCSLLHHITKYGKRAAVFGEDNSITKYKKYIQPNEESSKRIECITVDTNKSIIKSLRQKGPEYDLSIGHIKLHYASFEEHYIEHACKTIDKWTKKIWTSLPNNAMVVVVFGGEPGGTGASFIQVKTESPVVITV